MEIPSKFINDNVSSYAEAVNRGLAKKDSPDEIVLDYMMLRVVSRETTMEEVLDLNLPNRLRAACKTAWVKGHGLAAIQIGVPVRFAWFNLGGDKDVYLLNPRIIEYGGQQKLRGEGCLSIPNKWSHVFRAYKIKYESDGKIFTAKNQIAHIIQHEVDHMNGVLNVQIAKKVTRVRVK